MRDSHCGEIHNDGVSKNPAVSFFQVYHQCSICTFVLCPSHPHLFNHQKNILRAVHVLLFPVPFYPLPLTPNIFTSNLHTPSLYSSVNVTDQVSDPLTPTGKFTVLKYFKPNPRSVVGSEQTGCCWTIHEVLAEAAGFFSYPKCPDKICSSPSAKSYFRRQ